MACPAQGLVVFLSPEQFGVSLVRNDMVYTVYRSHLAYAYALGTKWVSFSEVEAVISPSCVIKSAVLSVVALPALSLPWLGAA